MQAPSKNPGRHATLLAAPRAPQDEDVPGECVAAPSEEEQSRSILQGVVSPWARWLRRLGQSGSGSFMLHDSDRPCLRKPGHVDRKLMSDVSDSMLVFDGVCQRVLQQAAAARDRNLVDATDSES